MKETKQTNRFALCFFLYYIAASIVLTLIPATSALPEGVSMIVFQMICFLPPIVFYFLLTKKSVKQTLRLQPLGLKNTLILIPFSFAIQPLMSFLSYVTGLFFPNPVEESMAALQSSGFLLSLVAVAVLPAIFEEASMRGIVLSGYHRLGTWSKAFACALLFGLMHMNLQQFPYAFFVGFIFCFLVERTDSIYASILPHFIINTTSVWAAFANVEAAEMAEEASHLTTFLAVSFMAVSSLPILAGLLYLFLRENPPRPAPPTAVPESIEENMTESLSETETAGTLIKDWLLSPSILTIFLIYAIFGVLPYLIM